MKCLTVPEARAFARKWLPARSGNKNGPLTRKNGFRLCLFDLVVALALFMSAGALQSLNRAVKKLDLTIILVYI
jgi:hypothetical protein